MTPCWKFNTELSKLEMKKRGFLKGLLVLPFLVASKAFSQVSHTIIHGTSPVKATPWLLLNSGGDITQDGTFSQSTSSDPTISHSQGSLTNGYVLVIAGYTFSAASSNATATYDGSAMTEIASYSQASFYHIKMFYRDLGTSSSGSKNAVVTHTDAITSSLTTVITFGGVKQGGGFTVVNNGGFAIPQTFNIATTSNRELVVAGLAVNQTAANVIPNGTQINENDGSGLTYNNQKLSGTGDTVTVTWNLGASAHGAYVGVVLQPAS